MKELELKQQGSASVFQQESSTQTDPVKPSTEETGWYRYCMGVFFSMPERELSTLHFLLDSERFKLLYKEKCAVEQVCAEKQEVELYYWCIYSDLSPILKTLLIWVVDLCNPNLTEDVCCGKIPELLHYFQILPQSGTVLEWWKTFITTKYSPRWCFEDNGGGKTLYHTTPKSQICAQLVWDHVTEESGIQYDCLFSNQTLQLVLVPCVCGCSLYIRWRWFSQSKYWFVVTLP